MTWSELEAGAPELAGEGWARFERTHVALLGTIREDGSPRISPVEPFLLAGQLVFGLMASPKLEDVRRNPNVVLHSSVSDVNGTEGEFKVYGRAVASDDPAIVGHADAWWSSRTREQFEVYAIDIGEAVLVAWDPDFGRMQTSRWTFGRGAREKTRTYP